MSRATASAGMLYVLLCAFVIGVRDDVLFLELRTWLTCTGSEMVGSLCALEWNLPSTTRVVDPWEVGEDILSKCEDVYGLISAVDVHLFRAFVRGLPYEILLVLRMLSIRHRLLVDVCICEVRLCIDICYRGNMGGFSLLVCGIVRPCMRRI